MKSKVGRLFRNNGLVLIGLRMLLFGKEKWLQSLGDNAPETAYLSIADQLWV